MNILVNENLLENGKLFGLNLSRSNSPSLKENSIIYNGILYHQIANSNSTLLHLVSDYKEEHSIIGDAMLVDSIADLGIKCEIEGDLSIYELMRLSIPNVKNYDLVTTNLFPLEGKKIVLQSEEIRKSEFFHNPEIRPIFHKGDMLMNKKGIIFFRYEGIFFIQKHSDYLEDLDNLIYLYYNDTDKYNEEFNRIKEEIFQQYWKENREQIIETHQNEKEDRENNFNTALTEYMNAYQKLKDAEETLFRLQNQNSNIYLDAKNKIEKKYSKVKEILLINDEWFVYKTNTIYLTQGIENEDPIKLGKYIIYIDLARAKPYIVNTTKRVRGMHDDMEHPHAIHTEGGFCMSEDLARRDLPLACKDHNFEKIVMLIYNMLISVAPGDGAGSLYKNWKNEEKIEFLEEN